MPFRRLKNINKYLWRESSDVYNSSVVFYTFGVLKQFTSGKADQVVLCCSLQMKINALFFMTLCYIPQRRIFKMDFLLSIPFFLSYICISSIKEVFEDCS